jgi:hypothetical protein
MSELWKVNTNPRLLLTVLAELQVDGLPEFAMWCATRTDYYMSHAIKLAGETGLESRALLAQSSASAAIATRKLARMARSSDPTTHIIRLVIEATVCARMSYAYSAMLTDYDHEASMSSEGRAQVAEIRARWGNPFKKEEAK